MSKSKKHHYIPRFYLKGFTNRENRYFVYDKQNDKLWQSSPENSFLENHRNTGIFENPETKEVHEIYLAEELLSRFEDRAAKALAQLKDSLKASLKTVAIKNIN
jgi:hypothetical protein